MSDPLSLDALPQPETIVKVEDNAEAGITPQPNPFPLPIPIKLNNVSGRYRGTLGQYQLELRVDVDGSRPCNRVSGDYYQSAGAIKTYFGSMKSGPLTITWSQSSVTIRGTMSTTFATTYANFTVTIPRTVILLAPAAATITFFNAAGSQGATYVCPFESAYFRTVRLEEDYEVGNTIFGSYNTGT